MNEFNISFQPILAYIRRYRIREFIQISKARL